MNRQERSEILSAVRGRFQLVEPYLTEQSRRAWAAAEALASGSHGPAIVTEATGLSQLLRNRKATPHRLFSEARTLAKKRGSQPIARRIAHFLADW